MDNYVKLAKLAAEEYIKKGRTMVVPKKLPPEFYSRKAGVFVTIHKGEELRGCIGTYLPTKSNVAEEIINNAILACSADGRFFPISENELPELGYEVSILSEPRAVTDKAALDPKEDGIIVRCADGRCGLLLPDLEGVETTEQQINIACQKGGIDSFSDDIQLYYFKAEKHK